jgi:hypothetical protein
LSLKIIVIDFSYRYEGVTLARKEAIAANKADALPMLKTVEQMSRVSGIGENKLHELMDSGELEFVQNENRRSDSRFRYLGLVQPRQDHGGK